MTNRCFLSLFPATLAVLGFIPTAGAGQININLTEVVETGTGPDGTGALGGGIWNRIDDDDAAQATALVDSNGGATAITATDSGTGNPGGLSQTGNAIQKESWGRSTAVTLQISGLLPDQVYKVVVYGDRIGSGTPNTDTYNVNGLEKTLPNPDEADVPLPGVEDIDYAEFVVDSTAGGQITISAPAVAGVQIQGLISSSEKGPQVDCRISKSGAIAGGKGDGIYKPKSDRTQTITQRTIGGRAKRYYINIENDGEEIDRFYAMGFWKRKEAKVKIIDRGGNGNITSAVQKRDYRYELCRGETRRFKLVLKPANRRPGTISARFCASPSTKVRNRQDCVSCLLKVK